MNFLLDHWEIVGLPTKALGLGLAVAVWVFLFR